MVACYFSVVRGESYTPTVFLSQSAATATMEIIMAMVADCGTEMCTGCFFWPSRRSFLPTIDSIFSKRIGTWRLYMFARRKLIACFALSALAFSLKWYVVVAIPIYLIYLLKQGVFAAADGVLGAERRATRRDLWRALAVSAAIIFAVHLPVYIYGGLPSVIAPYQAHLGRWHNNQSVAALIDRIPFIPDRLIRILFFGIQILFSVCGTGRQASASTCGTLLGDSVYSRIYLFRQVPITAVGVMVESAYDLLCNQKKGDRALFCAGDGHVLLLPSDGSAI